MAGAQKSVAVAAASWMLLMILVCMMCCFGGGEGWKVDDVKGWKVEELKLVNVGGKVMCQDCSQGWNQWAQGSKPIKGCKVAVTCMDARKRVVYHASDDTDEHGEFDVPVAKYADCGKEIKPEGCSVRLISSPDQACNVMTNSGGGRSGVKLYRPSHVYPGMVKYTVGPFYFTSPMCDEPDTTSTEPNEGNGY